MAKASYHHGDLPRAVMAAALEDLEAGDRFAVNFHQIARRLGVSHGAIYRHFPSKQHLVDALARSGFEQLTAAFQDALAPLADASARERIAALPRVYVRFALAAPALTRLMFSGAAADRHRDPALKQAAFEAISVLQAEVTRAAADGLLPPEDVLDATRFLWASIHGLAALRIEGQLDGMLASDAEFDRLLARSTAWLAHAVFTP